MPDISPFGSIASGTKSSQSSKWEESSKSELSQSASSQSALSTNPGEQSTSEEDLEDEYYGHISRRGVVVRSSIPKEHHTYVGKEKTNPRKIPITKQREESVTNSSERSSNISDDNGTIDVGTEIETTVPNEKPKPQEKKKLAPKKQKESTYPSDLSRNVSGGTKRICWNSDPSSSFSDWRVEVLVRETQQRQLFHLHRNIIGFGPRKSVFFKEAFAQQQDGENNTTKLILPESQATVFPMVLDYIYYTREARQALTASRACAMYNIAERLEIISLEKAIMEFYRKNTSLENVDEFFKCAKEADALNLIAVSKAKVGTMILQKPELGKLVPPVFLIEIIEIYREEFEDVRNKNPRRSLSNADLVQSKRLSMAAYLCVSQCKHTMNEKLWDQLTNEISLPAIDVAVALPFLTLSAKFGRGSSGYTTLQRRCVTSITENWSKFQKQFSSSEKVSNALKKLPSHVLADIVVRTTRR
ncbi:MAG: hypothetical protein SGBAC_002140 [Bacillariaceae sp.]